MQRQHDPPGVGPLRSQCQLGVGVCEFFDDQRARRIEVADVEGRHEGSLEVQISV